MIIHICQKMVKNISKHVKMPCKLNIVDFHLNSHPFEGALLLSRPNLIVKFSVITKRESNVENLTLANVYKFAHLTL